MSWKQIKYRLDTGAIICAAAIRLACFAAVIGIMVHFIIKYW